MSSRPKFSDLTPEQQLHFGNGLGPYWFSDAMRAFITKQASWFFKTASWRHHDFGYVVGGDRWDRARCDWKFYAAMLRDAWDCKPISRIVLIDLLAMPFVILLALILASIFYTAVRIGGQFGSFEYRDSYASLDEVIAAYEV